MNMTDVPESHRVSVEEACVRVRRKAVAVVLALWIFGIGAFFFIRFTSVVYDAHRETLGKLLESLMN